MAVDSHGRTVTQPAVSGVTTGNELGPGQSIALSAGAQAAVGASDGSAICGPADGYCFYLHVEMRGIVQPATCQFYRDGFPFGSGAQTLDGGGDTTVLVVGGAAPAQISAICNGVYSERQAVS